ncbi:hypothetical protein [Enterococcus casseliflavus]|uniref:Uncharacterized protein n=1 Tax=Enterococcus casseliflavus TaxID=37734 RepID=A0ABD6Z0V4_ENTCA|nr:hypothetical protein [Enterococcus casseliflavus]DAH76374.1 MAG TPA: head closure knob [Caudoviricetes sp.]EOH79262.1 hypothetical protein UAM_02786 [Enterococcus casseliflavus ATCC 49996]EOU08931.1 hypothetical protein I582_02095 [Enterococcus casseliflavus ATCC 49996]MDT2972875.1 hypothetical protein [Enterococcus casseliflavus]MDT2980399.1 hypothetical protein [Enterococcus casseliflavus]
MRLRERDLQIVYLKKRKVTHDEEAEEIITYPFDPIELSMNVQAASGTVNAQIYGSKLETMKACKYQGDTINEAQNELDGVCVYVGKDEEPDFTIKSIQTFSTHKNIMLERNDNRGS